MASDIQIASNALLLIGDSGVNSLNEPGAGPTVARNLYHDTKRAVLAMHPWSFALKEQFLDQLAQDPDDLTGYDNAFREPVDSIRIWATFPNCDYAMVGEKIYSNEDRILARYVFDVSESLIPAHVVKLLEYKLAAEFAMAITEDQNMSVRYEALAMKQFARASSIDAQQYPQVSVVHSPFVQARFGNAGFGHNFFGR